MPIPHESERILSKLDPSYRATEHLNAMLEDLSEVPEVNASSSEETETAAQLADVDMVRKSAPVIPVTTERDSVRLLILTSNVSYRQLGSFAQKQLLEFGKVFAEIHVLILNEYSEETVATVRLSDNVWLYSTDSRSWWKKGIDAYQMANRELIFAGVFRADVIVAEDPFEAGLVGYALSEKYHRPFEIHLIQDVFASEFKENDEHAFLHSLMLPFVLNRVDGVRVNANAMREKVIDEFPELSNVTEVLPVYHNLTVWRDMTPTFSLKERYSQFNFIILHISDMQTYSHTSEVIHGAAPILRTHPTLALVIVGNGPHRPALEKQVIALGIQNQVEFEPVPDEHISHMKSADVLIYLSENVEEDVVVLEAASVRLPIIASSTTIAGTLFKDGESAFLCAAPDPAAVSRKLREFLKDNQARTRFSREAQDIVFERIEQDYAKYLLEYRSSIERCLASDGY